MAEKEKEKEKRKRREEKRREKKKKKKKRCEGYKNERKEEYDSILMIRRILRKKERKKIRHRFTLLRRGSLTQPLISLSRI